MKNTNYYEWEVLKDFYLEDSFVLDMIENINEIKFIIDTVLCESHPLYRDPKVGEQYCYAITELKFHNPIEVQWIEKEFRKIYGPLDEVDYGNIYSLRFENEFYHIEGEWGYLKLKAEKISLSIITPP